MYQYYQTKSYKKNLIIHYCKKSSPKSADLYIFNNENDLIFGYHNPKNGVIWTGDRSSANDEGVFLEEISINRDSGIILNGIAEPYSFKNGFRLSTESESNKD